MSASILINLSRKSNFCRNLRSLSCTLSPKCYSTYFPKRDEHEVDKYYSKYLSSKVISCNFCTRPTKNTDVTKNVISEVKIKKYSNVEDSIPQFSATSENTKEKKLGLFARFKLMYKQYWYVLIPVHVVTSIGWFAAFYYLSKSGVDVAALLQTIHISDSLIEKVKASDMGHVAIAYLLYKIATPVRYAVTLGGSTFVINYLSQVGYIKPMPSKEQLVKMYEDKKADIAKKKQDRLQDKGPRS